jgi:uncharacterized protein (DUF1330 family)
VSKGYWIVHSVKANRAVLARYGARFLVRWGQQDIVRERQVVIEFPD